MSPDVHPNPACIQVRGARTHNLKGIDLDIPKNALVVVTGLSGSGKSSLAFDTLYAEGQRRYVESLSAYARQFLARMDKPDVDWIAGLSPAIAIEQKASSHNPRSTVGTVTEIHDYLRLLFARAGTPFCPVHGQALVGHSVGQMVDAVLQAPEGARMLVLAPLRAGADGAVDVQPLLAAGYVRFRVDETVYESADLLAHPPQPGQAVAVVVDRLRARAQPALRQRLAESLEAALKLSGGRVKVLIEPDDAHQIDSSLRSNEARNALIEQSYTLHPACPVCGWTAGALEPRMFSFNAPQGACPTCDGLGHVAVFDPDRVVAWPELSLAGGAVHGWDRRNATHFAQLQALAQHLGISVDTPWQDLPEAAQRVVLHGSGDQPVVFAYTDDRGRRVSKSHPFEGVLPALERRWRSTDSAVVREDLARLRSVRACPGCGGERLRTEARHVHLGTQADAPTLPALNALTLADLQQRLDTLRLGGAQADIAQRLLGEIRQRLRFLNDVGLGYLSLGRSAETLSGGESQRIRLASQIGSGLSGVMYVLDEPSIGLHQRDNDRLIATLLRLRDLGNSVLVVEHDEDMMRAADHLIDLGPGAGVHGGRVMAAGTYAQVAANPQSPTGQYLSGARAIALPAQRRPVTNDTPRLGVRGARGNTLRHLDVDIPLGRLVCVTGVSGSGKSTLVNDTLYRAVAQALYRAHDEPAPHDALLGWAHIDKVIAVDQSPIGRTPRSNPATYTGLLTPIRELLAQVPMARERGYGAGRFSFNVSARQGGGRCEACEGDGVVRVEMHFLPDVYVPCDICQGARYNRETLEVTYKGLNIAQILDLTAEDALRFFDAVPAVARKLQTLLDVGLGYLKLGQAATTLSGGEAQRVKLALELSKRDTGRTLYVLDEPTTGLHFADIDLLLRVLQSLCDAGNTVLVIEHNLDVIKTADWLIDLGPEGGAGGGSLVAQGTPEQVAADPASITGRYLATVLARSPRVA